LRALLLQSTPPRQKRTFEAGQLAAIVLLKRAHDAKSPHKPPKPFKRNRCRFQEV